MTLLAERLAKNHPDLAVHGKMVGRYAALTARQLGIPRAAEGSLRLAGELHDVGKLEVPRSILDKPGPLSDHEWARIRTHPVIGADLIRDVGLAQIAEWVIAHHERPDGRGYPRGLDAADIPLESAVLSVADAYHAMTTDRPYKAALDPAAALDELGRAAGSQFDPIVVDAFIPSMRHVLVDTAHL
ncbi:MAG TPA: HD domain-containing phosphohydrolase [Solirubrobacterales bacterium]|nr:HD domain-containing phosphohydrolase [Solirubrobacterales bacterium]